MAASVGTRDAVRRVFFNVSNTGYRVECPPEEFLARSVRTSVTTCEGEAPRTATTVRSVVAVRAPYFDAGFDSGLSGVHYRRATASNKTRPRTAQYYSSVRARLDEIDTVYRPVEAPRRIGRTYARPFLFMSSVDGDAATRVTGYQRRWPPHRSSRTLPSYSFSVRTTLYPIGSIINHRSPSVSSAPLPPPPRPRRLFGYN